MASNNKKPFYNNRNRRSGQKQPDTYVPPYDAALLAEPISALGLASVLEEKLKVGRVETLQDVAKRRGKDFYKISTFNKRDFFELQKAVAAKGIAFRPEEPPKEHPAVVKAQERATEREKKEKERNERGNRRDTPRQDPPKEGRQGFAKQDARQEGRQNLSNTRQTPRQEQPQKGKKQGQGQPMTEKRMKEEREKLRPVRRVLQPPQDAYMKINKNGKWGFVDRAGKETVPPLYDEVFQYREELCCVEQGELFGYIDRKGEVVIPIEYECAASFSEGYACVFKNGVCGYINKNNETVIEFKYDAGTPVTEGNCRVKKDGKWGELHLDNPYEIRWIN